MAKQDKPKIVGNDGNVYKCPMCKTIVAHVNVPSFPFCSDRCRLMDLGNWLDGSYKTSRPVDPTGHDEDLPRMPGAGEDRGHPLRHRDRCHQHGDGHPDADRRHERRALALDKVAEVVVDRNAHD